MKCLLVDDEAGIREGLAALLRLRGHEVRTAADRAAALALLAAEPFDVVVTDWRLPDGDADDVIGAARCPVIAASGHPEEVRGQERLAALLPKPVAPARLLAQLQAIATAAPAVPSAATVDVGGLPWDVRGVVTEALSCLGGRAAVVDDGVFVTLRADWPGEAAAGRLRALGGDCQATGAAAERRIVLRWCRDGSPDPDLPRIAPEAAWPTAAEFAIDFHGWPVAEDLVRRLAVRAEAAGVAGQRVHFLNLPPAIRAAIETSGTRQILPMKDRIGPRLSAALTDLWS